MQKESSGRLVKPEQTGQLRVNRKDDARGLTRSGQGRRWATPGAYGSPSIEPPTRGSHFSEKQVPKSVGASPAAPSPAPPGSLTAGPGQGEVKMAWGRVQDQQAPPRGERTQRSACWPRRGHRTILTGTNTKNSSAGQAESPTGRKSVMATTGHKVKRVK